MGLQLFKARRRAGLNLQGNCREPALVKWKNYNSRGASREFRVILYFIIPSSLRESRRGSAPRFFSLALHSQRGPSPVTGKTHARGPTALCEGQELKDGLWLVPAAL